MANISVISSRAAKLIAMIIIRFIMGLGLPGQIVRAAIELARIGDFSFLPLLYSFCCIL